MPDHQTPIADTLAGVHEAHGLGLFRRFGLSNFAAEDVQAVHDHCAAHGYVLPTVYQGSYNPVSRHSEQILFPTLRRLGMAFYAYSPSASGFLGKTAAQAKEQARNAPAGGPPFRRRWAENPKFKAALEKWGAVAEEEGVSGAELAYRWVAYHSALTREAGDALIIGASSLEQLEETLEGVEKGPLSDKARAGVELVWNDLKDEPPLRGFPVARSAQPNKV